MADYAAQLASIEKKLDQSQKRDVALRKMVRGVGDLVDAVADQVAAGDAEIKSRITASRRKIEQAIAEAEAADRP